MRYHSGSAGDLSGCSLRVLALRYRVFTKIHGNDRKFHASIMGAKLG